MRARTKVMVCVIILVTLLVTVVSIGVARPDWAGNKKCAPNGLCNVIKPGGGGGIVFSVNGSEKPDPIIPFL
jgi:hypothetical protein